MEKLRNIGRLKDFKAKKEDYCMGRMMINEKLSMTNLKWMNEKEDF